MASDQLNTTTNSSSLNSTGSPQAATSTSSASVQSGQTVQSGASDALLSGQGGISIPNGSSLNTVSLNGSAAASTTTSSSLVPEAPKHHVSWPLLGISGLFILVAIVLFVGANRSVKSTT
jgi:hypothetical protein